MSVNVCRLEAELHMSSVETSESPVLIDLNRERWAWLEVIFAFSPE